MNEKYQCVMCNYWVYGFMYYRSSKICVKCLELAKIGKTRKTED